LVSDQGWPYWREAPKLKPADLRQYEEFLGEKNPVDAELTKISEHLSFDFVATLLSGEYHRRGAPAHHSVQMWKIAFLGCHYGIRTTQRLHDEIQNNMAYKKFLGLALGEEVPSRSCIYRFVIFKLMPHIDEVFYHLGEQCREAGLLSSIGNSTNGLPGGALCGRAGPFGQNRAIRVLRGSLAGSRTTFSP